MKRGPRMRAVARAPEDGWILPGATRAGSRAGGAVAPVLRPRALVGGAVGFAPDPPAGHAGALPQQIALEALAAAGSSPLGGGHFIKPWLVLEVTRRIERWLEREARHSGEVDIDEEASMVASDEDEAWEMAEILASRPRRKDL